MDHDHNFKNLIVDYARQALEFFAPEEALDLERARITPLRQEQLKERLGERFRELDVPLLVEWPDGRREAVVFVLEEETTAGRFNIHRLAHYCLDIAELVGTERVVPVVIFLGRAGSAPRELHLGGERHRYLSFRYLACSLAELPAEHYFETDNLVARLNLPNMAHTPAQRLEVYARALRGLRELEADPERQTKYLDFIDIYAALDDTERAEFAARYSEEVQLVSSFAQRFTEQGLQQGLQQGRKQGEAMLLRQLTRKFGPAAAEAYRPRIESADAETLLAWSERILDADTPEDIFDTE